MTKNLIIIALIILVIYFYYQNQQNNQPIITEDKAETIQQLQEQVNHFQTLYQSRVEKDVRDSEKVRELEGQLTILEEIINKPLNDVETQTELSKDDITNLIKQIEYYQALSEQRKESKEESEKQLTLVYQDLKTISETAEELETLLNKKEQTNQEQLRKINVLFDEKAQDYETIDFNGLYSLLQQIAERERERANKSWWQRK